MVLQEASADAWTAESTTEGGRGQIGELSEKDVKDARDTKDPFMVKDAKGWKIVEEDLSTVY